MQFPWMNMPMFVCIKNINIELMLSLMNLLSSHINTVFTSQHKACFPYIVIVMSLTFNLTACAPQASKRLPLHIALSSRGNPKPHLTLLRKERGVSVCSS